MKRILVLGGYGNFGKRICQQLTQYDNIEIIIAGRNIASAQALVNILKVDSKAHLSAVALDYCAANFKHVLHALKPYLTIHTCGPFQGQSYVVPLTCIEVGSHYIDLADDRRFVCDITQLNDLARQAKVMCVSGASSVPGLSSVVVDRFISQFSALHAIDVAIAPGNKAERGEATVRAILDYTGQGFLVWQQSKWQTRFGWMNARRMDFKSNVGKRWLANVNVPDLELFPVRYPSIKQMTFQAGLELSILHFGMVLMACLRRFKLFGNWRYLTKPILAMSRWFDSFGTDKGAMKVVLTGVGQQDKPLTITWTLYADDGIGPFIPTFSTLILADQLIRQLPPRVGAMPCLGLYDLAVFQTMANRLGIVDSFEVTEHV